MAVGVRIRNAASVLQIDNTYQNLALRQKGTVVTGTATGAGTGWYYATISIPLTGIVAFQCANGCFIYSTVASGSTRTVTFWADGANRSINWFLFDTADQGLPAYGTIGVRIRDPTNGLVAFDSRMKYMRVLDQVSGGGSSVDAVNQPGITKNYAAGTQPAIVQGQLRYSSTVTPLVGGSQTDPQAQYLWIAVAGKTGAASMTISEANPGAYLYSKVSQVPIGLASTQYYYDYLVLDVAGL